MQSIVELTISQELGVQPADREIAKSPDQEIDAEPVDVLSTLAPRRAELDAIGPLPGEANPAPRSVDLGLDLSGEQQDSIEISLSAAIESAVNRNLAIQTSRLQPGIALEDLLAAQAIFDAVLFSNIDLAWIDEPQRVPVINGIPISTPFSRFESYRFETGVRKRFTPGTEVFVSTDLTRFRNKAPGIVFSPDPAYTGAVRLGVGQPLLRGFGEDVTTATIRIARNQTRRSAQQLYADLQELVAQTEIAYWDLDAAWRQLSITQWLVDVGVQVRDVMERRREFDIRPAQYSDAVARVEQRQADVIRARRQVRAASDAFKAIINDPQLPVATEAVLRPIDVPLETPITFNLREAILTAVDHREAINSQLSAAGFRLSADSGEPPADSPTGGRPEIRQAALDIDDASIRQRLANNEKLPLLNFSGQVAFFGLDNDVSNAYREANSGDFVDYLLGLAFEWPLGNRAAEASARAARLQRSSAVLNYQRTVQNVVLEVKNALRDVVTNLELIRANRSFRVAQAENLRTLLVEEELLAALTPEFLNLKFTRQETLAQARSQEVQALADFNKSLAALYRAMGTGLRMRHIEVEVE